MYVTEIDGGCNFALFLNEFLSFEAVLTTEVYVRASVDVLREQGNFKTQITIIP